MLSPQALIARRKERNRFMLKQKGGSRPRLCVHRSNMHFYAQIIDDAAGKTLVMASTVEEAMREKIKNGGNIKAAREVGLALAEKAKKAGIIEVVFDRGAYKYHGRVKSCADAAREGGLKF